jgi:peptide/nickel transport system permease protein
MADLMTAEAVRGGLREVRTGRQRARSRLALLLAVAFLAVLLLAAAWPEALSQWSPTAVDPLHALRPPGAEHLLGTDQLGRDILSRLLHGTRISLGTGLAATVLALLSGTAIGLSAALGGRAADELLMRAMDTLLALPGLLLALLVVATLGPGPVSVLLAIVVAETPGYARLVRGQALVVRRSEYVRTAVALGVPGPRILLRHVLPNSLGPLLALATIGIGTAIIVGSSLSFLGLGPRQPAPEWGAMLAEGRDFLATAWWLALFPGLTITATVLALNGLGRRLRGRLEGRPGR